MVIADSVSQTDDQRRHDTIETVETTDDAWPEERQAALNTSRSRAERAANDPAYEPVVEVDVHRQHSRLKPHRLRVPLLKAGFVRVRVLLAGDLATRPREQW